MARHRIERINEQIRREVTGVLRHEVKDPRIGMATITAVEASSDLSSARIFFTALGDEEERKSTMEGLRAATPYIRGELARRLRLRHVPELRFEYDRSLEQAMRIERLLDEVLPDEHDEDGGGPAGDAE